MQWIGAMFFSAVAVYLLYLLADAIRSGSIWVRGAREGNFSLRTFAHKRHRAEEPQVFWGVFVFYAAALAYVVWLVLYLLP
ncbi:MAG: hypothetical protein AAAFM81_10250 [Pseudomonadota bacterium]